MVLFSGTDQSEGAEDADISSALRVQADWCDTFGSPFTAQLCRNAADSFESGSVIYDLLHGWPEHPAKSVLALRLTGALHAAVLSGRAPVLSALYPGSDANWSIDKIWPAALAYLERDQAWVTDFLRSAPQTNETRRSIGLLTAFLHLADRGAAGPFHMLELGASAGLNQHWDKFRYETDTWSWGPEEGPLMTTDWSGPSPDTSHAFEIASRRGCDLNPLDIGNAEHLLRLRAYIWPDQQERMARLDRTIALALENGVSIDSASADDWIAEQLDGPLPKGATVVYHSIFYQYPPTDVRRRIRSTIEAAGATADNDHQLHWVRFEPNAAIGGPENDTNIVLNVVSWPGGEPRTIAHIDPHARFVRALSK